MIINKVILKANIREMMRIMISLVTLPNRGLGVGLLLCDSEIGKKKLTII